MNSWLNSISNIIPAVGKVISTFLPPQSQGAAPLSQTTQNVPSQPVFNGVSPQTRQGYSIPISTGKKESNNLFLYLIIGVIAFFLLFMKR